MNPWQQRYHGDAVVVSEMEAQRNRRGDPCQTVNQTLQGFSH